MGTNSPTLTVSPAATTQYWVRLTNSCGTSDSLTVVVNVTASNCPAVIVGTPTATAGANGTFTLAVSATSSGSSLTYAWFLVTTGGSTQVGTGNNLVVTPVGAASYFVRVTNACGNFTNSTTVMASSCTNPVITQPPNQTVSARSSAFLTVTATSATLPMHYQWYRGPKGTIVGPVGTDSATYITPKVTAVGQFWVRVTNTCGSADSETITITPVIGRRRATR